MKFCMVTNRCEEIFTRWGGPRMLTRDMFAVPNLLVTCWEKNIPQVLLVPCIFNTADNFAYDFLL